MNQETGTESFRVQKTGVSVRVELENGATQAGAFLCAPRAEQHTGRETVTDLLNVPARFVPFRPDNGASPWLLNKRRIVLVHLEHADFSHDPADVEDLTEPRHLSLHLADGRCIEAVARVSAPIGHTRTLDLLNESGPFVYLMSDPNHLVLNLDFVIRVSELEQPA